MAIQICRNHAYAKSIRLQIQPLYIFLEQYLGILEVYAHSFCSESLSKTSIFAQFLPV